MSAGKPTPWESLLQAGLRLGLSPESFWRLSVREWQMLTRQKAGPFGRMELSRLMSAFPDKEVKNG